MSSKTKRGGKKNQLGSVVYHSESNLTQLPSGIYNGVVTGVRLKRRLNQLRMRFKLA